MNIDIIRAWKDRHYRESLSEEEQALLPQNPVGTINLTDDELKTVSGGQGRNPAVCSIIHCSVGGAVCPFQCQTTHRVCAQPISTQNCNSTHALCAQRIHP